MTMSLNAACWAIANLKSIDQRREAIEKLPDRAYNFMSIKGCTPENLVSTKGMPFETFNALIKICTLHRDKAPETINNLMVSLSTVIIDSVALFGRQSPFISFAEQKAFVNKLLVGKNCAVALKLIEACAPYHPDFLSTHQKRAAYGVINQESPHLLPPHYQKESIRSFLPINLVNQNRIIEILHETGEDPVYLAQLCLDRDQDIDPAPSSESSKNYNLKVHFTRTGQWQDGSQSCIGVSGEDLDHRIFFLTLNGILVTEDTDPAKISGKEGQSLISGRQLGRRIKEAQKLMGSLTLVP